MEGSQSRMTEQVIHRQSSESSSFPARYLSFEGCRFEYSAT